jgi:hypothetical protein
MTTMRGIPLTPPHLQILGAVALDATPLGVRPLRLAPDAITRLPDGWIDRTVRQTSGIRLRFLTTARRIELDVRALRPHAVDETGALTGPEPTPQPYELHVDGERIRDAVPDVWGYQRLDWDTRTGSEDRPPVSTLVFGDLPAGDKTVEIWLPHQESAYLVELRSDARTRVAPPQPRWIHHGSSISHGSGATAPSGTWPAVAARRAHLDLTNLGFGGNALVDPFAARAIRDAPADLISLKLGINVVNHDAMRRRVFRSAVEGFLDTVRDGHPDTPLIVITPILCPIVETLPGPTTMTTDATGAPRYTTSGTFAELADGKLSLEAIRDDLQLIVARRRAQGDAAIHLLDGRTLYGADDARVRPLPDDLHPDAATHEEMGHRFAAWLAETRLISPAPSPRVPLTSPEPSLTPEAGAHLS